MQIPKSIQVLGVHGFEKAAVGTTVNKYGNEVMVYDLARVFEIFTDQGKSEEEAMTYVEDLIERLEEDVLPLFIHLDTNIGNQLVLRRGTLH